MKTGQPANIQARHKYYEDNKEAIIKDLLSKGKPFTRRKWRIPKGSLSRIINKWLTPEQREKLDSIGITEFAEDGQLPQFPQFSNSWETPTQVKWLEVFEKLLNRQPLTEGKE